MVGFALGGGAGAAGEGAAQVPQGQVALEALGDGVGIGPQVGLADLVHAHLLQHLPEPVGGPGRPGLPGQPAEPVDDQLGTVRRRVRGRLGGRVDGGRGDLRVVLRAQLGGVVPGPGAGGVQLGVPGGVGLGAVGDGLQPAALGVGRTGVVLTGVVLTGVIGRLGLRVSGPEDLEDLEDLDVLVGVGPGAVLCREPATVGGADLVGDVVGGVGSVSSLSNRTAGTAGTVLGSRSGRVTVRSRSTSRPSESTTTRRSPA